MKKWLSLLFVVSVMLFLSAGIVHAANTAELTPKLVLDGKTLQPLVAPVVMDKTVMIPVRIATANLGYKVEYDNKKKQVKVSNGSKQLVMTLDQPTAYLDNEPKKMIMPPTSISNNILIPLRFLGDSLDIAVFWDNQSKSAFLYSSNTASPGNVTDIEPPGGGTADVPGGTNGSGAVNVPGTTDGSGAVNVPGTTDGSGTVNVPGSTDGVGVNPDPGTVIPPINPVVSGNIHEVRYETNTVIVKYDGLMAPEITSMDNPKRLVIDLPNTLFAGDFTPAVDFANGMQGKLDVTDHPALISVRFSLFGDIVKAPRIVLDLNQAWDYDILNDPAAGEFRLTLKQPVPDKSLFTVVLDAGHGGSDPGAGSISGRWENDYNLSVVLKVQANSFTSATNGTETYYTRAESKDFANLMHALLVKATGLKDNGVRQKSLAVTRETKMPAILLESGYLSSKIDEPQLWTDDFQNRVAQAIADGIKQQLKLS
jgi:N-acetylmuramoyl-L-alanine amidase